jgi:hypothetical protein
MDPVKAGLIRGGGNDSAMTGTPDYNRPAAEAGVVQNLH